MAKLKKGDKAPDFKLKDQDGETAKLADYRGKRLLLYFYPKANTSGCTTQAVCVRDSLGDLTAQGIAVVGVSPDSPDKQKKFDEKHTLGFPLLCDEDHSVAEAYGVWGEKSMYGRKFMGIVRSSFLIDAKGKIEEVWYKVSPKDTVTNVLKVL